MKVLGAEESRREKQVSSTTENNSTRTHHNNQHNNDQNRQNNPNTNNNQRNQYQGNRGRYNNWEYRPPPNNNNWNNSPQGNNPQPPREHINQLTAEVTNNTMKPEETTVDIHHAINQIQTTNSSVSPYIECTIEGEKITLLIDTGATVSVLTEEVVDTITRKNKKIPQIPITNVQVNNILKEKIEKPTKQILCECKIGEAIIKSDFIQVQNIEGKGIIGADLLTKYQAQIMFNNRTLQIMVNDVEYIIPFSDKPPIPLKKKEKEQCLSSEESGNQGTGDIQWTSVTIPPPQNTRASVGRGGVRGRRLIPQVHLVKRKKEKSVKENRNKGTADIHYPEQSQQGDKRTRKNEKKKRIESLDKMISTPREQIGPIRTILDDNIIKNIKRSFTPDPGKGQ